MLTALKTSTWAYPMAEAAHIASFALMFGAIAALDLRLLGLLRALPLRAAVAALTPVALGGFALAVLSGVLLFATDPGGYLANRAFVLKVTVMMLAGCNAAWFAAGVLPGLGAGPDAGPTPAARVCAVLSLALWTATLVSGRWIGYL